MNHTSPWGPFGWRPLTHINQDLIYTRVTAPDTYRAWLGTLCTSLQGAGSNSLGRLNGMRLNEKKKKNLDMSLNEREKTLWAFVWKKVTKVADFHSA